MKRNFFQVLHVVLAILIGLGLLNINRTLSIIGSITLIICTFVMNETHSGLTIRYKIMQQLAIISLIQFLGFFLFQKEHLLLFAAIFLIVLFFEWKFRVCSSRWEA